MSKSIQTKPAPQKIKIVKTATVSYYFWVLAFVAITAPFWHYPLIKSDIPGICGYKWMSSFVYAIGNVLSPFALSLILLIISPKIKEYKKPVRLLAVATLYGSCYFLLMVIINKDWLLNQFGVKDMPIWGYRISLFVMAVLSGILLAIFNKAVLTTERTLTNHIKLLVEHIIDTKERYMPLVKKAAVLEQDSPPIDGKSWRDQVLDIEVKDFQVLNIVSD